MVGNWRGWGRRGGAWPEVKLRRGATGPPVLAPFFHGLLCSGAMSASGSEDNDTAAHRLPREATMVERV